MSLADGERPSNAAGTAPRVTPSAPIPNACTKIFELLGEIPSSMAFSTNVGSAA